MIETNGIMLNHPNQPIPLDNSDMLNKFSKDFYKRFAKNYSTHNFHTFVEKINSILDLIWKRVRFFVRRSLIRVGV